MAISLREFAKYYYLALKEITSVIPAHTTIPKFLRNPSFVIACSDIGGRFAIDIISHDNIHNIIFKGNHLRHNSSEEPIFLIEQNLPSIAQMLFPQDDKGALVSITIDMPHVILNGMAFSSKKYNDKYWLNAKFYRKCAGSIPFIVTPTGSMLGLDLLWGAELEGQRQERIFEFVKIYGSETLPNGEQKIRDDAFCDIGCIIPKLGKELNGWSFSTFLNNLKTPIETNVLILGSYDSEADFVQLKSALKILGYNGFLLKDSPDLPIQSNLEKLFSGIICSCYIIVLDKKASGHIAELSHMLQFRFRPVIVLRDTNKPSTSFLEDKLFTDEYFRVAIMKDISPQLLLPHIKWARGIIDKQIKNFNALNYWRSSQD